MKVFLAGGGGAIGKRLIPRLRAAGHQTTATTQSADKLEYLRALGADPIVVDGLDRNGVTAAVVAARPDVVVHQMTALGHVRSLRKFDDEFALTNRLRTDGLDYLLQAARIAGARTFVAQSYAGWPNAPSGGRVTTEEDPFNPEPPRRMRKTLAAIRHLESTVIGATDIKGIVLRYGSLYGPGTAIAPGGVMLEMVRHRKLPLFGDGQGVWSFTHVDDAARATLQAIERASPGIYNIVDDDPAEVAEWLPDLAQAIGAKPPYRLPAWLGRIALGEAGLWMMTGIPGSSNAKAKRVLEWRPDYATWRDGFRRGLTP